MAQDQISIVLKVLVLLTGIAAYLLKAEKPRRMAVYALLVACTLLACVTLAPFGGKEKDKKGQAVMESSTAEFVMKLSSGFDDLFREASAAGMASMGGSESKKVITDMHEQALKAARHAVELDPDSVAMRFRQLVIAGETRSPLHTELAELKQRTEPDAAPAARLIEEMYVTHAVPQGQVASDVQLVEKLAPRGWLRDVATIEVHRNGGETKLSEKLLDKYHTGIINYMWTFFVLVVCVICFGFMGVLILACQLFFWPRQLTPDEQRNLIASPVDYGWLKVYGVFIGWLALECAVSPILGDLIKPVKKIGGLPDPVMMAVVIFVIYTLTNLPALILAWIVAIKPAGLKFFETVKLRAHVGPAGPVRLVFSGICAWLCAIPLIMVSAVISKTMMQSHGSASPILPIISEVVRSGAVLNIFLFVFVLGVMPALCEETLFRGFLYTYLRRKHNVIVSVLISAVVFAGVHMDPGAFLQLFVLGVVFALAMERTKSLIPSMIAHCLWNSGTLVLMMVAFGG